MFYQPRRGGSKAATGKVFSKGTTPSAPTSVVSRHSLDGAATPPNLGGEFPFGCFAAFV
jgi:hypothetical protein